MVSSTRWSDTNYISVLCNNSTPSASYRKMLKYAGHIMFYYIYFLLHDIGIPIWLKQLPTNLRWGRSNAGMVIIFEYSPGFFYIVWALQLINKRIIDITNLKKILFHKPNPQRIPCFDRDYLSSIADKYLDKYKWFKAVYQDALFPYFRANSFLKTCRPLGLISLCLRR